MTMTKSRHPQTGCIDGMLPVNPIIREPSVIPCPLCRKEDRKK